MIGALADVARELVPLLVVVAVLALYVWVPRWVRWEQAWRSCGRAQDDLNARRDRRAGR